MKHRTLILLAVLGLVGATIAVPAARVPVVTGHTTFADMQGLDPCLGAVAGIVEAQVLWFDDSFVHSRTDFMDNHFLFASSKESGDPTQHVQWEDPRNIEENADNQKPNKVLVRSGVWYNFTDPNGATWNVTEVYWDHGVREEAHVDEGSSASTESGVEGDNSAEAGFVRNYAWYVRIGEAIEDAHMDDADQIGHTGEYNFVNMINTCKFSAEAEKERNVTHDPENETHPGFQHPNEFNDTHDHEVWEVELKVGSQPDVLPLDAEPDHAVTYRNAADVLSEAGTR